MHKAGYQQHGFTIVELLVVIVVIGILAAITVVSYTGISQKAIVAMLQSDLGNSAQKLKLYRVEHDAYPVTLDGSNCPTGPADTNYCLKPSSGNTFAYSSSSPYSSFSLVATNTNGISYYVTDSSGPVAYASIVVTGGNTVTTDGLYTVRTFTSGGTLIVTGGTIAGAQVLVVGGGGAGGYSYSGGGGAGQFLLLTSQSLSGTITVTVGAGGTPGTGGTGNGVSSSFGSSTAIGGGEGGYYQGPGHTGASGGGAGGSSSTQTGGTGTAGYNGGTTVQYDYVGAAGGGGAGTAGHANAGNGIGGAGGAGLSSAISGSTVWYAGGGGGYGYFSGASGGSGGGGAGAYSTGIGGAGASNTGSGGGGSGYTLNGAAGGSGIVIVRYLTPS